MKNSFAENISKDDILTLPIVRFEGRIVVVDSVEGIAPACADLLSHKIIGFDTETRPTFKPGIWNTVGLLQLSTPGCCYLFRLCNIPLAPQIIEVLESTSTIKVGVAVINDLRVLETFHHIKPDGFIDIQDMVSEWGIAAQSLRKMAAIILGGRVSKAQRLSNWNAVALTPAQQTYAATDAWICIEMYEKLMQTDRRPLPRPVQAQAQMQPQAQQAQASTPTPIHSSTPVPSPAQVQASAQPKTQPKSKPQPRPQPKSKSKPKLQLTQTNCQPESQPTALKPISDPSSQPGSDNKPKKRRRGIFRLRLSSRKQNK